MAIKRAGCLIITLAVLMVFAPPVFCGAEEDEGTITVIGTVEHFSQEGGFYGIKADDGNVYRPERLTRNFKREGMRVKAALRPRTKKLLLPAWSIPAEVIKIERYAPEK
jgi:hypothetical protein